MAQAKSTTPAKSKKQPAAPALHPFDALRREINHLFDGFDSGLFASPFRRSSNPFLQQLASWDAAPAVDIAETDAAYEVSAEMPGLDEKDVDITVANGSLRIRGEKREDKEQKKKDYYLSERRFGSFERSFRLPANVDTDKIAAEFKNGVLKVTLPKKPEARKPEKKIAVKSS